MNFLPASDPVRLVPTFHLGEEHQDDAGNHEDNKQGAKHSWVGSGSRSEARMKSRTRMGIRRRMRVID